MTERRPYHTLEVSRGAIDRAGRLLAEHLAETPAIVDAERLDTDYDVGLKHERGPGVVRDYLALLAYAETTRHLGDEVSPEVNAELTALGSASLAVLRTKKAHE